MSTIITPSEDQINIVITDDSVNVNVTSEPVVVNVTEEIIQVSPISGAYPLPTTVYSVFGRTGSVVAQEGDYDLSKLSDVTLLNLANNDVLSYNGTNWVNEPMDLSGYVTIGTAQTITGEKTFEKGLLLKNISSPLSQVGFTGISGAIANNGIDMVFNGTNKIQHLYFNTSFNHAYTFPNASGTIALLETTQTFTGDNYFQSYTVFDLEAQFSIGHYLVKGGTPSLFAVGQVNIYSETSTNNVVFRDPSSKAKLVFNNSTQTYTFPAASGTIALTSDIPSPSTFVPYTGATGPVDLGFYDLIVNGVRIGKGSGGNNNTRVGALAFISNTIGGYNTAIGNSSLSANTIGDANTAIGNASLISNTTGSSNTAIGGNALANNINGGANTAIGYISLGNNTSGGSNVAVGRESLAANTLGNYNVAIGRYALYNKTISSYNTAIGGNALYDVTTGTQNIALGYNSGKGITTGSGNTIIGSVISLSSTLTNNIILADGYGNIRYQWDGTNNVFTGNVNLGVYSLTANALIKNGGVDTQFLKADGSVDNNVYLTTNDLPSTLSLYATTTASAVSGYTKLVTRIDDPDYNTTAVDVSTGTITTTNQFIAALVSPANLINGNPGIFNVSTYGNIKKVSGSGEAEFYFEIYKRTSAGVETLVGTSSNTLPVVNSGYSEFFATAIWNDGVFDVTDTIVLKYYATRIAGGSDPVYNFQFGGTSPVRTLVPIPIAVIPNIYMADLADVENVAPLNNEVLHYNSTSTLWEHSTIAGLLGYTPANDASVVHIAGTETITGNKTFSGLLASETGLVLKQQTGISTAINGYTNFNAFATELYYSMGNGASTYKFFSLQASGLTNNTLRTYTLPDASGTIALTSNLASYVPYTGATASVDLGIYNITAASLIKSGGTSAQILAADGSVITAGTNITISGGTISASGGGGSISLAAIGSTPNANAATLTGSVLNLEPASASFGGVVTTGTQTFAGVKTFSPSVTASAAIARGTNFTPTLVAAANNDVLVGVDINPTFTNGAFTGLQNIALRIQNGDLVLVNNRTIRSASSADSVYTYGGSLFSNGAYFGVSGNSITTNRQKGAVEFFTDISNASIDSGSVSFGTHSAGSSFTWRMLMFKSGNLLLTNTSVAASLPTDNSYRLDVQGTLRTTLGAVIGYSASTAAPTNGLAVNGAVTIANSSAATYALSLQGSIGISIANAFSLNYFNVNALTTNQGIAVQFTPNGTPTNNAYVFQFNKTQAGTRSNLLIVGSGLSASAELANNHVFAVDNTGASNGLVLRVAPINTGWAGASVRNNFTIFSTGNIVIQNAALGATDAGYKLDVLGTFRSTLGAVVGYSATTAAPTNGLAVSGNVLIGTATNGGSKLTISGLPTSATGLTAGDVWNNGGVLTIV